MADVKVTLTGNELAELRMLLQRQAHKLNDAHIQMALKKCGYDWNPSVLSLEEQLKYIAEKLLTKLS